MGILCCNPHTQQRIVNLPPGLNWIQMWFENIRKVQQRRLQRSKSRGSQTIQSMQQPTGWQGQVVMAGGSEDQFRETQNIMKDCCTLPRNQASGNAPLAPRQGFSPDGPARLS